jgi:DNA-binding transcriptional LysR family regulator
MPEIELRLLPVAEKELPAILVPGDGPVIDMAFARLPLDAAGFSVIQLWEETPVAVAAKDHPLKVVEAVTLAELSDEDTVDGQDEAALDLVAAGVGIARMPQSVFRGHNRRDVVARPITDAAPTRIALVWRTGPQSELVDEFIGIVRGRTAASSRGSLTEPEPDARRAKAATGGAAKSGAGKSASGKGAAGKGAKPGSGKKPPNRGKPSSPARKPRRPGGRGR